MLDLRVEMPSISILSGAGRECLKHGMKVGDDFEAVMVRTARKGFEEALARHAPLFERCASGMDYRYTLEMQDDLHILAPQKLASIDLLRTALDGRVHFTLSSRLLVNTLLAEQTAGFPASLPESLWPHEFIHLMDWKFLERFMKWTEEAIHPLRMHFPSPRFMPEERKASLLYREWEVLKAFTDYRDEGLAVLYELLCGERSPRLDPAELPALFRGLYDPLFQHAHQPVPAEEGPDAIRRHYDWIRQALERILQSAYPLGPFMILDALWVRTQTHGLSVSKPLLERVLAALQARKPVDCTIDEAVLLMAEALRLDLSDILAAAGNATASHPFGILFDAESLFRVYHRLSLENDLLRGYVEQGGDADLYRKVQQAMLASDAGLFCRTLEEVIGGSMEPEELVARRREPMRGVGDLDQAVVEELKGRAENLHALLDASPAGPSARVARLALSYLYDEEDYINDSVAVMGLMDDLLVLRAAGVLACKPGIAP